MTTYTTISRIPQMVPLDPAVKNQWGGIMEACMQLIDNVASGVSPIALSGTTKTLTANNNAPDESRAIFLNFTGALGADCTVTIPAVARVGFAINNTTGNHNVILTTGSGTTLTLRQTPGLGFGGLIYFYKCDGTNITDGGGFASQQVWQITDNNNSAGFFDQTLFMSSSDLSQRFASFIHNNSTQVGSITGDGSGGTTFNTTSDYRLKNIHGPADGSAIGRLSVYLASMKTNPGSLRNMLLAHEVAEHFPHAVTGERDAVDDKGKIVPQMLDKSDLIPDLIAYAQALEARIAALETSKT